MSEQAKPRDFLGWGLLIVAALLVFAALFPAIGIPRAKGVPVEKRTVNQLAAAAKQYRAEYGAYPSGGSSAVMAALMGKNERQIVFFEPSREQLTAGGKLVDPWGLPYRFDLSDPKTPRIWSSGKDRRDDGGKEGSDDIPSWR